MIVVTIGGVTVGLAILIHHLVEWWPETTLKAFRKRWFAYLAPLLPFLAGWAYGALGILTTMGLIGWAFDTALWASNWLGDAALWIGVGEAPGQTAAGAPIQLSATGNCLVLLLTVGFVVAVKKPKMGPPLKRGAWCGLCLGTSAGVAGAVAGPLAMGVNTLGAALYGALGALA